MPLTNHVYLHAYKAPLKEWVPIGGRLRAELRMLQGLIFVAGSWSLSLAEAPYLLCSDASEKGFALAVSPTTPDEVRRLARYLEKWRFREEEAPLTACPGDAPDPGWSAALSMAPNFREWIDALEAHEKKKGREQVRDWPRDLLQVPVVGAAPVLEPGVVNADRWHNVLRGAWAFAASIHVKEAKAELLGLRRLTRTPSLHERVLVSLTDSLPAACAFEKGRSRDWALRAEVRRAAAHEIGASIQWRHRYTLSEHNPTDWDSRAADRGAIRAGQVEQRTGGEMRKIRREEILLQSNRSIFWQSSCHFGGRARARP